MNDHLQQFVSTYQKLFPGEAVPPMPEKPEDLSMTVTLALRNSDPTLWQNMFGSHGAPLPVDVQQRLLTGQVYPEDAGALRAAHMDAYAAEANRHAKQSLIVLVPPPGLVRRLSTKQRLLAPSNSERDRYLSEWPLHL